MNYFSKNITYFLKLTGFKQKYVAEQLDVDSSTIWKWKQGTLPQNATVLNRIARFFSTSLHIPWDLFDGGQALLDKNFEELLTSDVSEHNLQESKPPVTYSPLSIRRRDEPSETQSSGRRLTDDEAEFIFSLREFKSSRDEPLHKATLNRLLVSIGLMGVDSEEQQLYIRAARSVRGTDEDQESDTGMSNNSEEAMET